MVEPPGCRGDHRGCNAAGHGLRIIPIAQSNTGKPQKDRILQTFFVSLVMTCLLSVAADADGGGAEAQHNWPQWRGPLGTGVAPVAQPPVEWNETKNIRWKTVVPGKGHSTPI